MAKKRDGKKTTKNTGKTPAAKPSKRINVELAPGVVRLLKERMASINDDPDRSGPPVTYADLVNEALNEYLPPMRATGTTEED